MYEPKTTWQCDIPWEPHTRTVSTRDTTRHGSHLKIVAFLKQHKNADTHEVAAAIGSTVENTSKVLQRMRLKFLVRSVRVAGLAYLRWEAV
jgi:hypothetical protein